MKTAFITGTTRGLGKSLVRTYGDDGWRVVELSRQALDLATLDHGLARSIFNRPSDAVVFINNAATLRLAPHFSPEEIEREIAVNLVSPMQLIFLFLERHPAGCVVNITSGAAARGYAWFSLYCAAKAGMEGFLRALESQGVQCLNFDPGVIDTDMQAAIRGSGCPEARKFVSLKKEGHLRDPKDVAREILLAHQRRVTTS